jgi:precorrin-2 dehydrogenase
MMRAMSPDDVMDETLGRDWAGGFSSEHTIKPTPVSGRRLDVHLRLLLQWHALRRAQSQRYLSPFLAQPTQLRHMARQRDASLGEPCDRSEQRERWKGQNDSTQPATYEVRVTHTYYPVALDLDQKNCLLVGGGDIAEGKLEALIGAGARLTVVSPDVRTRFVELANAGHMDLHRRAYQPDDLSGVWMVIAATEDRALNARIAGDARAAGVLVNAVDDPPNCDFFAVSVVRRGDLQIAISTNGRSPAFARWMRESLDISLPAKYEDLLDLLGDIRDRIRQTGLVPPYERWRDAITDDVLDALQCGDRAAAHARLWDSLAKQQPITTSSESGH